MRMNEIGIGIEFESNRNGHHFDRFCFWGGFKCLSRGYLDDS